VTRGRRGQATVEYLLLVCSMITIACVVGYFLKNYTDVLVDKVGGKILDAIVILALG
jgi:uncharacterized protein (UPF0333 family)